ncbi:hypothetical protein TIFTF001_025037 [Ficus carica]|uniref:C2H2-type domain-containing protein n=1 Tax=Ficus carica TaxID=3494 RepID=A0AA88APB5_FICCA|nr:hypothetical protein TIFTF001_025037 [Ficus carica]
MLDSNESSATSSPPKNFICPFCNRPFISARSLGSHIKVHRRSITGDYELPVTPPQPENARQRGRVPSKNRHPQNYNPYARPNDLEVFKGGDEQPSAKTSNFLGNYQMPDPTMPAGGPTESAKSSERTVSDLINAGEEVSSKKEENVDLELKLYWS